VERGGEGGWGGGSGEFSWGRGVGVVEGVGG